MRWSGGGRAVLNGPRKEATRNIINRIVRRRISFPCCPLSIPHRNILGFTTGAPWRYSMLVDLLISSRAKKQTDNRQFSSQAERPFIRKPAAILPRRASLFLPSRNCIAALEFSPEWERQMARYYFHIQRGDKMIEDREGADLPDIEAAQYEAITAAR